MRKSSELLTFTVPLSSAAHRLAQQFCRQQSDRNKAKQVYLNTLAVSAVEFYLRCTGWETNWSASSSWNSVWQTLMDVADLEIPNLGKLECRPVLPDTLFVHIPPEVSSERIGYVAVQLDRSLQQGTLLGFTKAAPESGELPITELLSLEDLLLHLCQIRQSAPITTRVLLNRWFENLFEAGWRSLEALLATDQEILAFSLRSNSQLSQSSVKGAKLIDLGLQLKSRSLALLVALAPETDQKVGILVQVHPTGRENYLPPNIRVILLLESGVVLQSVQSRTQDNYIQLKRFRGNPGECFNIQVVYGDVSVTEAFEI